MQGYKTSTASFRTPDFDRRYLLLEHLLCRYSSSSSSTWSTVVGNDEHSLFFVYVKCDLEMKYSSLIFKIQKQYSAYFKQYVYQYRGRFRCKSTKTSTSSFRAPNFDCRY